MSHDSTIHIRPQVVFLGSSTEGKKTAAAIEAGLHNFSDVVTVDAWYHFGTWSLGSGTLESLQRRLRGCDFAVLLLSPDDLTMSARNPTPQSAPRDNVLFELGLFMGHLGRERAFFCFPANEPTFKVPSDLFGVTAVPYKSADQGEISVVCTTIVNEITKVSRAKIHEGTLQRPQLHLNLRLPSDAAAVVSKANSLSGSAISTLKLRIKVDDVSVDDVRIYFGDRLNLYKSSWAYRLDKGQLFYDATKQQLSAMKSDGCVMSFEVAYPRAGRHVVEAVALCKGERLYARQFEIDVL